MQKFDYKEVYLVTDIKDICKVSRMTVESWINSKELKAFNAAPYGSVREHWRVMHRDLVEFLKSRQFEEIE